MQKIYLTNSHATRIEAYDVVSRSQWRYTHSYIVNRTVGHNMRMWGMIYDVNTFRHVYLRTGEKQFLWKKIYFTIFKFILFYISK